MKKLTNPAVEDGALAEGERTHSEERSFRRLPLPPLPEDAPLLTFDEVGCYLRLSAASVRKLVDGRADMKDDTLGTLLRGWVVRLSPHRRYIQGKAFLAWIKKVAGEDLSQAG